MEVQQVFALDKGDDVVERILRLSNLAKNGQFRVGLVVFSMLLLLLSILGHQKPKTQEITQISILYGICSQLTIASAFGLACVLVAHEPSEWPTILLLGYVFLLGILGLLCRNNQRQNLLRHANILLFIDLILRLASDALPQLLLRILQGYKASLLRLALLGTVVCCNLISLVTPQEWTSPSATWNILKSRSHEKPGSPSPEETCSYFSYYVSYGWLTSLIWKGNRQSLTIEDLPPLPSYDEPLLWLPRILEARRKGCRTIWTLTILLRKELAMMVFISVLMALLELTVPFAMYHLLGHISQPDTAIVTPYLWVVLLFLGPLLRTTAYQQSVFVITRLSVRLKISLVQELFRKAIYRDEAALYLEASQYKVSQPPKPQKTKIKQSQSTPVAGEIETLMSYDVDSVVAARDIVLCGVAGTVSVALAMGLLYRMLGWPSMAGLAILVLSLPFPMLLARRLSAVQTQIMQATEDRLSKIAECLPAIRTIKYFAWEKAMSDRINAARQVEQTIMWKRSLYIVAIIMTTDVTPLLSNLVMFSCYVLITGKPLTSAIAFTSLTLVEIIRAQFVLMSSVISKGSQAKASLRRLDQYFEKATEIKPHPIGAPAFKNATLSRSRYSQFKLKELEIAFIENGLNVITGPSGSGKTSLLLSLLGETTLESGEVQCSRDIGYVSQSAWLQHETVRQNIVFNSEFEQSRYDAVVRACCLAQDFKELSDSDLTDIGENGTVLSGGQRQRVALARAIYSKAPVILLDDVFSALDVITAVHVYNHCFCSDLLRHRTIILVTQVKWIAEEADLMVKLDSGKISASETRQEMVRIPVSASRVVSSIGFGLDQDSSNTTPDSQSLKDVEPSSPSRNETVTSSSDNKDAKALLCRYLVAFGGHKYASLALFTAFLAQVSFFMMMFWLSVWVGAYDHEDAIVVGFYLGVYATLIAASNLFTGLDSVVFRNGAWNAAKKSHQGLVKAVLEASLSWYNTICLGRINNRFSRDIDSLDGRIVESVQRTIGLLLRLLLRISAIGSIMPIFTLPTAAMCVLGYAIGSLYTKTATSVKCLASESQSPVFAHFSEVLAGLSVIRARDGMTEIMQEQLAAKLAVYARAWEAQFNTNRWVSVRSDLAASMVALGAGLIALRRSGTVSAGLIGFSLTNAVSLGQTTIALVRAMNELEIEMTSFERVQEYNDLHTEEKSEDLSPVPARWPSSGTVEFRNVTARYTPEGPDILKNISFTLRTGERVAIVGRTGSGKSTLALSCLRVANIVSGSILYDGIDITELSLERLRQSLTVIPQDTIFFSGDIAYNLDPTNTYDRHDLENALIACSNMPALKDNNNSNGNSSKISLSTPVAAGGRNFSHGQRQILGLARSLVKQSKLILLDEATASMDYETDAAIQDVLRTELKGSTLVTIAHRLRTIIDYDRVIVMSEGRILEMGSPKELFEKKGVFTDMVMHGGEAKEMIQSFNKLKV